MLSKENFEKMNRVSKEKGFKSFLTTSIEVNEEESIETAEIQAVYENHERKTVLSKKGVAGEVMDELDAMIDDFYNEEIEE
jgi:hypothetical protein